MKKSYLQTQIRTQRIKLIFFLGSMLSLFFAILWVDNLLLSFIIAFTSYYVLSPFVDYFERKGFSRSLSTMIPFCLAMLMALGVFALFASDLVGQVLDLKSQFPRYLESTSSALIKFESGITKAIKPYYSIDLKSKIEPTIIAWSKSIFENLPDYFSKGLTILFLAPFLTYFMLVDGNHFLRKLLALVPNRYFELVLNLNYQVGSQMGGFIRARLLETALVSLIIWLGLFALGFPYALLLSIFAGAMNIIPYLGPVIGFLPVIVIHFANLSGNVSGAHMEQLWPLMGVFILAQVIDTVLIVPFVVAKIVDLHPVSVVLAIMVGAQTMGVLGMIISIPVFSALKVSIQSVYRHLTDFRD